MNGNDSQPNSHLKNGVFFFVVEGGEGAYTNMHGCIDIFNMKSAYKTKATETQSKEINFVCWKQGEKSTQATTLRIFSSRTLRKTLKPRYHAGALEFRSSPYRIQLGLLTVNSGFNATGINKKGCLPHDAQNLFIMSLKDEEMSRALKHHPQTVDRPHWWILVSSLSAKTVGKPEWIVGHLNRHPNDRIITK